jgi:hypothetical protein
MSGCRQQRRACHQWMAGGSETLPYIAPPHPKIRGPCSQIIRTELSMDECGDSYPFRAWGRAPYSEQIGRMPAATEGVSLPGGGRPWEAAPTSDPTEPHPAGGHTAACQSPFKQLLRPRSIRHGAGQQIGPVALEAQQREVEAEIRVQAVQTGQILGRVILLILSRFQPYALKQKVNPL